MTESDPLDPHPTDRPNQLPAIPPAALTSPIDVYAATLVPALIANADDAAGWRYVEFFTANIRNPNTRRAYARAGADFAGWCSARGLTDLSDVEPVHVATYVEQLKLAPPSIKQRLAALRRLFD